MGKPEPDPRGGKIVDLSNSSALQARLDDARARRAEVLKKAGRTDDAPKSRRKPWEDAPATAVEGDSGERVDFHDRMTRFKALAKVEPAPEKSAEALAEIDRKVFGTTPEADRAESVGDVLTNIFARTDDPVSAPPPLVLTEPAPTPVSVDRVPDQLALSRDEATAVDTPHVGAVGQTSWLRTAFRSAGVMVAAVALFVSANGVFLPALFWDSTPPALQTGLGGLSEPLPGPSSLGFQAPPEFADDPVSASTLAPGLIQPASRLDLRGVRPPPRPAVRG